MGATEEWKSVREEEEEEKEEKGSQESRVKLRFSPSP